MSKPKPSRDDFSKATIVKLAQRVSYRCSKPDCRVPTIGPAHAGGITSIGTAAHITAAAKGGPRFDDSLTAEQRRSYTNGIWLCAIHGREVDSDDSRYSVSELLEWKSSAENFSHLQLGKPQPKEDDATKMLLMAATGSHGSIFPGAITKFHQAFQSVLNQMDPRFEITTQYGENGPIYKVSAKQPTSVTMRIRGDLRGENISKQFSDLVEHGLPVKLNDVQISIQDAPSLNEILGQREAGPLIWSQIPKAGEIRLRVISKDGRSISAFPPIPAEFRIGTLSGRLKSSAPRSLLDIEVIFERDISGNILLTPHLDRWNGLDIRRLPNYDDMFELFVNLARGGSLGIRTLIDGQDVMQEAIIACSTEHTIRWNAIALEYTQAARSIAKHLDVNIQMRLSEIQTRPESNEVINTADTLELSSKLPSDFCASVTLNNSFQLPPGPNGVWRLPMVRFGVPGRVVAVFGQDVTIPAFGYYFSNIEVTPSGELDESGMKIATVSGTDSTTRTVVKDEPEDAPL
ncbi:hypothetical protein D7I39_10955 [Allopusillimonas ginsengisoli]|nr:hypothetical protein D7I39_10955 [Allopusillimonas ginsengisoli]